MHIVHTLADFIVSSDPVARQAQLRASCRLLVTDLIAAAGAGIDSALAISTWRAAQACHGRGDIPIWFRGMNASVLGAAVANSAAASALDLDDGHRGAAGHPGAGIIPAALAVAQAVGASDDEVFNAIIVGYDVALRIATARPFPSVDSWASGRWVGYGVAAAAARLMRLNAAQTAHALAIAGAEGPIGIKSGSSKYQGSSVKEQIPAAVAAGITAAYRARFGATGPLDILNHEEKYTSAVLLDQLGIHWWLQDCYVKPYACCRYMHAAIDAIIALRDFDRPVLSLEIETFARGLGLNNEKAPVTLEGAQYSYYFSCALAAIYGEQALQPVNPESLKDPVVLDLSSRISLRAHGDFSASFPATTPCRVLLDQGREVEVATVIFPLGDVANPMSFEQVVAKFIRITKRNIVDERQQALVSALTSLPAHGFAPLLRTLCESLSVFAVQPPEDNDETC